MQTRNLLRTFTELKVAQPPILGELQAFIQKICWRFLSRGTYDQGIRVPIICNHPIRLLEILKSATYRVIGSSMKHFHPTNHQPQQIFAALVLTSILSLGLGTTFVKAVIADPVKNPQDITNLKQFRDRQLVSARPQWQSAERQLPASVVDAIRREISRSTNIPPGQLKVVSFTQEDWSNSCLDLGKPDQPCGQVYIKNGWRVVMSDGRQTWTYRTDSTGYMVRSEDQATSPSSSYLPKIVASAVLQAASERTGLRTSELRIVKSDKITTNACLGLPRSDEGCSHLAQEAWEVTVEGGKQHLVYRASSDASEVRLKEGETERGEVNVPQSVADAVLKIASDQLGVPSSRLKITKAEKQTWTDSCLGLPSPVERCMTRLTPGWRVVVAGKQQTQVYRTDNTGLRIRAEDVAVDPSQDGDLPNSVANAVLQDASTQSELSTSQLRIIKAEQREWPNGCLGLVEPGRLCNQMITPGWYVTVRGGQQSFVYRTNASGSLVKLEKAVERGNHGAVPIPKRELPPPLSENAIFRVISTGGFAGQTYETTLLNNGRMMRKAISLTGKGSTPDITYVSSEKLRQFKQVLAKQSLSQFNGLSYPAPKGSADYITVTISSQDGTTRYADISQDRLPKALQEVIQAWNQIARSR